MVLWFEDLSLHFRGFFNSLKNFLKVTCVLPSFCPYKWRDRFSLLFICSLKTEYTGHKDVILGDFSYFIRYAITLWMIYRLSENSWYGYQIAFDIGNDSPNDNDTSLRSWRRTRQRWDSYDVSKLLTTLWLPNSLG